MYRTGSIAKSVCVICLILSPRVLSGAGIEQEVYVKSFDGAYVAGYLRVPDGPGPHPAIMFIHGGIGGSGMEAMKGSSDSYVQNHFYADGYAVFQVDYRRFHFGDEELEDMVACYRHLRSRPEIDKTRIGIIGGSHGGYLALMLATRVSPAAVVSFAGLVDIVGMFYENGSKNASTMYANFEWREKRYHQGKTIREEDEAMEKGELGPPKHRRLSAAQQVTQDVATRWGKDIEVYKRYSPKEQYGLITSPLLYVVGSEDRLKTAGKGLIENLASLGRTAKYSEHPGMRHGFYWGKRLDDEGNIPEEFYRALKLTIDFMRKWVKQKK